MGIKEQLKDLENKVALGLEKAYQKMVEFKKRKNSPLIVSRDGEVVEIEPEKILPTTRAKKS